VKEMILLAEGEVRSGKAFWSKTSTTLKKDATNNPMCLLHIENQETKLYLVSHYPLPTYYVGSKVLTAGKDQI